MGVQFHEIRDSVADRAVKIGDYLQQSRNNLSGLAVRAKNSAAMQWENLKQINLISEEGPDTGLAVRSLKQNDHPASATENAALMTEPSKEPELNKDTAPLPESKTITEPETPKAPAIGADEKGAASETRDHPKTQRGESQIDAPKSEPPQLNRQIASNRQQASFLGNFEVVQDSFLRDKPEFDAAITTLLPGTRVRVESNDGDYLRVRSLNDPQLRGYVHREDAFFEPIR
jgi:hypothetical protein